MSAPPEAPDVSWIVEIRGHTPVMMRAQTRSQARYRCAVGYREASIGSVFDGLKRVVMAKRAAHLDDVPESLLRTNFRGWVWRNCP